MVVFVQVISLAMGETWKSGRSGVADDGGINELGTGESWNGQHTVHGIDGRDLSLPCRESSQPKCCYSLVPTFLGLSRVSVPPDQPTNQTTIHPVRTVRTYEYSGQRQLPLLFHELSTEELNGLLVSIIY